jgi:serine/threonine-protein kinase
MGLASAARVRAELAGDLDVVVHKALAPDAAARYQSAGALGDDLEAWLAHRPVSARRPTWHYRAGKALRRHPVAALATAVAVGIIALLAMFGWQQQQRTLAEGRRAQATVDFLYRMLAVASPEVGGKRGMTIGELVARADGALEAELDLPDDVRAGLRSVLGLVAYHEGQEVAGIDMARRAADLARAGAHASTEVDAVGRLVTLLIYGGRCDEVRPLLEGWEAAMARVDAAAAPEVAIGYLTGRARVAQGCDGKLEEAARFTGAAVEQLASLPDTAPRRVVRALVLTHHARTLNGLRRLAEARAFIDEGLRQAEGHPDGMSARLSLLRLRADNAALGEDYATAAQALGEAVASAPGHASAFAEVRLKASWARRLAQAGERTRALAVARDVVAEADRRAQEMAESRWMVLVDVADALYEAGACSDVPPLLTAADRLAARGMPADWRTIRLKVEAFCLSASGAHTAAARVAAEALAVGKAYMPAAPAVERRLAAIAGMASSSE